MGLTPIYLAGLILLFETVREPALLLQVFGTPSVAEELSEEPSGGRTAGIEAVASGSDVLRGDPEDDGAATEELGAEPDDDVPVAVQAVQVDAPPQIEGGKSADDLAKNPAAAGWATGMGGDGRHALAGTGIAAHRDPSAGDATVDEAIDPAAAAAMEEALGLSRSDRREVQRRLQLAEFDPRLVDGIFGPDTRSAISDWQKAAGLPATGYVDEAGMALLVAQTSEKYRDWRSAERARAARQAQARSTVVIGSAPPATSERPAGKCRRLPSGEIAFGSDVGCNFRAFSQNLRQDFQGLKVNLRELFD